METTSAAATDATVTTSRNAHAEALKARQRAERGTVVKVVPTTSKPAKSSTTPTLEVDPRLAILTAWREANAKKNVPAEVLAVVDAAIARAAKAPRTSVEKAPAEEVAAFFASTNLSRKQIAAAVGVSVSVIAVVQNPRATDKWSRSRYEAAKVLILAAAKSMPKAAPAPKAAKS